MIGQTRLLGVICARGSSRRLPGKNIRPLGGRPMIAWSIEAAAQSAYLDRTIVSTDSEEIRDVAVSWGADVPFLRPAALAGDATTSEETVLHALEAVGEQYDAVVSLQPTSPLRVALDIDRCVEAFAAAGGPAVLTVARSSKPASWLLTLDDDGHVQPLLSEGLLKPRQDTYLPNGAVYVALVDWLRRTRSFSIAGETSVVVMPPERSVDVDTMLDFQIASMLLSEREGA